MKAVTLLLLVLLKSTVAVSESYSGSLSDFLPESYSFRMKGLQQEAFSLDLSGKPTLSKDSKLLRAEFQFGRFPFESIKDRVAIYACLDASCSRPRSLFEKNPIQFKYVKDLLTPGQVVFHILIRSDIPAYIAAYISGTSEYPEIGSVSIPILVPDAARFTPLQVRLSLVSQIPNAMRIMWTMPSVSNQSSTTSGVMYGLKPGELTEFAAVFAMYTYSDYDFCDVFFTPAATSGYCPPGLQLETILRDLIPDVQYFFKIKGHQKIHSFRSSKLRPSRIKTRESLFLVTWDNRLFDMMETTQGNILQILIIKVSSIEDGNTTQPYTGEIPATDTIQSIGRILLKERVDVINHIGDISYATGQLSLWNNFMFEIESIANSIPWMTAIGNHELGYSHSFLRGGDSQGECGVPYSALFPFARLNPLLPDSNGSIKYVKHYPLTKPQSIKWDQKLWEPYYSYNLGLVHFVVLSTENNFTRGSAQYSWLVKDLSSVDRKDFPWVIVLAHRPMYVAANFPAVSDSLVLQQELEPLLSKYMVDIFIAGHHHSYQRAACPILKNKCDEKGILHIVTGNSGYAHSPFGEKVSSPSLFAILENSFWGYSSLDFVNHTHLYGKFIRNTDDRVIDQFWVRSKYGNSKQVYRV